MTIHRLVVLATLAALASLAAAAPAAAVSCGDTLLSSVTLTEDLVCGGVALFIGADDVTIDLAGHSISGPPETFGIAGFGVDRAAVMGPGSVLGFAIPVYLEGGSGHLVRGVFGTATLQAFVLRDVTDSTIQGNTARPAVADANVGVWVTGAASSDNRIVYNDVEGYGNGIGVTEGRRNTVADNFLRANLSGIALQGAVNNLVRQNTLIGNGRGIWVTVFPFDRPPRRRSNRNRILGNRIFDSDESGVLIDWNPFGLDLRDNLVRGNVVRGGERGVWIRELSSGTTVESNVLFDQSVAAIDDDGIDTVLTANVCWPGSC
jgi:nitrous oxidase accessory protein NosD